MTTSGDERGSLRIAGQPIAALLPPLRARIVERVVRHIAEGVPGYAGMPTDLLEVDVRAVARENLLAFEASVEGRRFPEDVAERIYASAYGRAEEGLSLELVQEAYFVGTGVTWDAVVGLATVEDLDVVRTLGHEMLRFLAQVLPIVTSAYVEEMRARETDALGHRKSILSALAGGLTGPRVASTYGVTLADSYLVLAVDLRAAVPAVDQQAGRVVTRRTIRAIEGEIGGDRLSGVLFELDAFGGLILLPHVRDGLEDWTPARAKDLVERIGRHAVEVRAAYVVAAVDEIPAAVALGHDVLEVVTRGGRPPGLYGLDDVLVDFQLARPGPVADLMQEKMAALADHPDLLETVHAYLDAGRNRAATAVAVNVHPNTVDYRLRRVEALLGINPATTDGSALLRIGLLAFREERFAQAGPVD
ncbi:helix-turn-helix domain-containing protein [Arthrobacter sp. NEB 688]|uniref:PucR family transcriptional regulator n=1 Tax=Arthrobacter sp. NEB 688 TaxID=904039 RepID=UPI0015645B74|nr:helix-turn-helix domain-containing protein [Arthrobacter sp. NEB 688]QKE85097.1 helix-turn-helix domain-containing protein [Arthrobacter sp. NEB 688]